MTRIADHAVCLPLTKRGKRAWKRISRKRPVRLHATLGTIDPAPFELLNTLSVTHLPPWILDEFIDSCEHEPWEDAVAKEVRFTVRHFKFFKILMQLEISDYPEMMSELHEQYKTAARNSHVARRLTLEQWYLFKLAGLVF